MRADVHALVGTHGLLRFQVAQLLMAVGQLAIGHGALDAAAGTDQKNKTKHMGKRNKQGVGPLLPGTPRGRAHEAVPGGGGKCLCLWWVVVGGKQGG